ncbi:hypothetical protein [Jannaschia aquimarina]|uniref:Lipoprotein n=1 Tax=Jannaschia aquimarina TaxID=935700 RepID=A0A0D1CQ98_9RHOB|nr:hypothetical protein [Jannaschia aquimarina]KIT16937.1 hypothetical protein jaqu_14360 [Jannaschia aquimarina]SNT11200.1 hypothetical protein SAMN05421775_10612 [Jannaschia aquimarina]
MKYVAVVAIGALAACTAPPAQPVDPAGYVTPDYAVPFAIRALLPRGITAADVRERDGCYAYSLRGTLYPVQRPDGGQYCIG